MFIGGFQRAIRIKLLQKSNDYDEETAYNSYMNLEPGFAFAKAELESGIALNSKGIISLSYDPDGREHTFQSRLISNRRSVEATCSRI
jgi:hypothetical protein